MQSYVNDLTILARLFNPLLLGSFIIIYLQFVFKEDGDAKSAFMLPSSIHDRVKLDDVDMIRQLSA